MAITGGCLCGDVRYRFDAEPIAAYLCHCDDCKRRTGGPYAACALISEDALHVEGEPARFEGPGGSGEPVVLWFCGRCGSPLFSTRKGGARTRVLRIGSLDDPGACVPSRHIWTQSALPWALPDDGTPRHPRGLRD